jgi:Na+-driven multidrug efflux pump
VFLVAAFALLPVLVGNVGLWLSVPCAEALTTLVIFIYIAVMGKRVRKERKILGKEQ